jgi:hypothetical protein
VAKHVKTTDTKLQLEQNKHNQETTSFYLLLKKHVQTGAKSPADITATQFKPKLKNQTGEITPAPDKNLNTRRMSRRFDESKLTRIYP